ncbi:MAG: hypothetical protein Q8O38_05520 [Sulfurimicrobium sp.]|nr:hypothetical protein [Sulfurimicrobium sp.]
MKKLTLLLFATLYAGAAQAAPLSKCVDDKGRVYYGDSIPAEVLDKCRTSSELTSKGMEKKKTRYLTEEERKAQEGAAAQQKLDAEKALEQKRRDRALLDTYSDEKEINLSRDRNLQATQAQIDGSQMRAKSTQGRFAELRKQADRFNKNKKPIPAWLSEELKSAENELGTSNETVAKWQQEYKSIQARFEEDKKRFRELKGFPPEQPAAAAPAGGVK